MNSEPPLQVMEARALQMTFWVGVGSMVVVLAGPEEVVASVAWPESGHCVLLQVPNSYALPSQSLPCLTPSGKSHSLVLICVPQLHVTSQVVHGNHACHAPSPEI
ncbi:hypothetical protein DPMN_063843 [Dreissena polymorpha]|uniref:Uncharacterized protein n=1 Tax=Dreissena polymorpha TaxID=45954 RepID=A0A9D4HJJ4_DREPO|nr:hypothetical protein DPMN_063843 [Dreissena polymorpha]